MHSELFIENADISLHTGCIIYSLYNSARSSLSKQFTHFLFRLQFSDHLRPAELQAMVVGPTRPAEVSCLALNEP